jgi:hypothetical protein
VLQCGKWGEGSLGNGLPPAVIRALHAHTATHTEDAISAIAGDMANAMCIKQHRKSLLQYNLGHNCSGGLSWRL